MVSDFDAIAEALGGGPSRISLTPAERALLAHIPAGARRAIDVGCGDGVITRALASRGLEVVGIDISPRMIELARSRTDPSMRVDYRELDVMGTELSGEEFDVVVSIAVAHHFPLGLVVARLARLVAPGGTLLIQDVMTRRGLRQLPANVLATVVRRVRELVSWSAVPPDVVASYRMHGDGESYLDVADVASAYGSLLPSAFVLVHLEWRYSVVWKRSEP